MRKLHLLVALIPLLTLACTAAVETSEPEIDLAAERANLLKKDHDEAEAYVNSDTPLETTFEAFTRDTRVLAPDMPMTEGWEASREVFAKLEELPGYSLSWTPEIAEVGGAADLGYTIGTYDMTVPDSDGNLVKINGKYLSVWRRQADGEWKIAVDMFNANGPPVPVAEE